MRGFVMTIVVSAATINQVSASFTWDCSWWYLSGHDLITACETWGPSGGRVAATLDLNNCIGIDSGSNAMIWETK